MLKSANDTVNLDGKSGILKLRVGIKDGRTIINDAYNSGLLKIAKPDYQEADKSKMHLCQICLGGGLTQGDDHYQEVEVESGARLFLTTQSSTKIYRTNNLWARQTSRFQVGRDALLEYFPEPIVPFAGSRFRSEKKVFLDKGAIVLLGEIITPGRIKKGETFQFDYFHSITQVYWQEQLIFWNNQILSSRNDLTSLGLYDGYTHQGSLLIFAENIGQKLVDRLHQLLSNEPQITAGAGLTYKHGIVVRLLGRRAADLQKIIYTCRELIDREIGGTSRKSLQINHHLTKN